MYNKLINNILLILFMSINIACVNEQEQTEADSFVNIEATAIPFTTEQDSSNTPDIESQNEDFKDSAQSNEGESPNSIVNNDENSQKRSGEKEPNVEHTDAQLTISVETAINIIIIIVFLIVLLAVIGFVIISMKLKNLSKSNLEMNEQIKSLNSDLSSLSELVQNSSTANGTKTKPKTKKAAKPFVSKTDLLKSVISKNKLSSTEIASLNPKKDAKWFTVGNSIIGKSHLEANPKLPCQDSNHFLDLDNGWKLMIVCDGAGSAKKSEVGSSKLAKEFIPACLKDLLKAESWYNKGVIPNKEKWKDIAFRTLEKSLNALSEYVKTQPVTEIGSYASTVILVLYKHDCALVANVGDGRAGYMNDKGELKPLFTPYKGEEANATIFLTSDIWENATEFIQFNLIKDNLWSIFALSDGMEKHSFNCSLLGDDEWVDPNLPHKNFFIPVIKQLKLLNSKDLSQNKLEDQWGQFLQVGSKEISEEPDDKTMVVSVRI